MKKLGIELTNYFVQIKAKLDFRRSMITFQSEYEKIFYYFKINDLHLLLILYRADLTVLIYLYLNSRQLNLIINYNN